MPAIYAHDTFGNRVMELLSGEIRDIIWKYRVQFRIGLQGPDYLFFYEPLSKNEINQTGYRIHEEPAEKFMSGAFQVIEEKGTDSMEYAYLMGFICHFALDSECHPFVSEQMRVTGAGHIHIESEFEKYLMYRDHVDPFRYRIGDIVPTDDRTAGCIAGFYDGITPVQAKRALQQMRFFKNALVAPGKAQRAALHLIMKASGSYDSMEGHLLKLKDDMRCRDSNAGLFSRYEKMVPVAAELIRGVHQTIVDGAPLCPRFERNFESLE